MMSHSTKQRFVAGLCPFLVLLLVFASYRPAVCLLSLSAPSDRGDSAPLFPNQNKPRPTRQQTRATVERVTLTRVCEMPPATGQVPVEAASAPTACPVKLFRPQTARATAVQPDYLKPFLAGAPYPPLPPPA